MGHHYRERHKAGDYNPTTELTVAELKDRLKALGESTTGNKDELAERLTAAQAAGTTTSEDVAGLTG